MRPPSLEGAGFRGGRGTVYTLGHSTRSLQEFIRILKAYGIETVVDVRRFPGSRRHPHFAREILSVELPRNGVKYVWMGDGLGGYRPGGYQRYMRTREFRDAFRMLVKLAGRSRTAVVCSEALWFRCHRRFLADRLAREGFKVIHIYDEGRSQPHRLRRRRTTPR